MLFTYHIIYIKYYFIICNTNEMFSGISGVCILTLSLDRRKWLLCLNTH